MGFFGHDIDKFKNQDFSSLRQKCMSARDKKLFEDPYFPPTDSSLNLSKPLPAGSTVVWKRASELSVSPKLYVEKASTSTITIKEMSHGRLGNCWFVAACAALSTLEEFWSQIVPDYKLQEWDPGRPELYAGIFHFRFWRFGKWIDVVIDDYLPIIDNQLIFCHSTTDCDYWCSLLEKAYAKLCGSYGAMEKGGNLTDALVDFTSGLSETIILQENGYTQKDKKDQFQIYLLKEHSYHCFMCCTIAAIDSSMHEALTKSGLIIGHPYVVTEVKEINVGPTGLLNVFRAAEKVTFLRLRDPWRMVRESSPSFEDASTGRTTISENLGLTVDDDAEFWIPFDDFINEFTDLTICHMINTSSLTFRKTWHGTHFTGRWQMPNSTGGSPDHSSFLLNPQYCFDIPKDDSDVMIQLIQKDIRGITETTSSTPNHRSVYPSIGFHIMKVEENREHKTHRMGTKTGTSKYVKSRSVFFRGALQKGRYILIPTTYEPDVETEFYLQVYGEEKVHIHELKTEYPEPWWLFASCFPPPDCVTSITVEGLTGLAKCSNYVHNC